MPSSKKDDAVSEKHQPLIVVDANQHNGMTRVYLAQQKNITQSDQHFEQLIQQLKNSENV